MIINVPYFDPSILPWRLLQKRQERYQCIVTTGSLRIPGIKWTFNCRFCKLKSVRGAEAATEARRDGGLRIDLRLLQKNSRRGLKPLLKAFLNALFNAFRATPSS